MSTEGQRGEQTQAGGSGGAAGSTAGRVGRAEGWRRQWEQVSPFFAFSAPIRRAIYTTNAVESLNSTVRRAVRSKGHFPHEDAARKLIYLALRGVAAKWKRPPQFWWQVKGEFAIRFEERFTMAQG